MFASSRFGCGGAGHSGGVAVGQPDDKMLAYPARDPVAIGLPETGCPWGSALHHAGWAGLAVLGAHCAATGPRISPASLTWWRAICSSVRWHGRLSQMTCGRPVGTFAVARQLGLAVAGGLAAGQGDRGLPARPTGSTPRMGRRLYLWRCGAGSPYVVYRHLAAASFRKRCLGNPLPERAVAA